MIKVKGFQGTPSSEAMTFHRLIFALALTVAPAELEGLLMSHPDILDAGVIGVTASDGVTELPKAFIVPRGGLDQFGDPEKKSAFEEEVATWVGEQASHESLGKSIQPVSHLLRCLNNRSPPTRDYRGDVIWWIPYHGGKSRIEGT